MHENCLHYQLIRGEAIEVEKGDYYDYCTDDDDDLRE